MPAAVRERRPHCARTVRSVTIDAIIRREKPRARRDRALVVFIRVLEGQHFAGERKSRRQILIVRDEPDAVAAIEIVARGGLSRRARGTARITRAAWGRRFRGAGRRREDRNQSAASKHRQLHHSENTKSIPPQLVQRARSGRVVPRSRTSYGRFAATSPAIKRPMSPPMPE